MAFWLMKSKPSACSWNDLVREGRTHWDGVRNDQAANNMKFIKAGDKAFAYHPLTDKEIVGISTYPTITALCSTHIRNTLACFMQNGQGKALTVM